MLSIRSGLQVALAGAWLAGSAGCGGAPGSTSTPAPAPSSAALADPATADPADVPELKAAPPLAVPLPEAEADKVLGELAPKLAQIGKLSPKTHEGLLKNGLVKVARACEGQKLVAVEAAPGLIVEKGATVQVRDFVKAKLVEAGALAQQRGTLVEVVSGHSTVEAAAKEHNRALVEAALEAVKAAPKAEQNDGNFVKEARAAIGDEGFVSWQAEACDRGKLGGMAVQVRLVAQTAGGGRGNVLVAAAEGKERFTKDTYGQLYWDKPKGKSYRTLTEIMSAGAFVRDCPFAYKFSTTEKQASTWRCKTGNSESWDPENRPIQSWQ